MRKRWKKWLLITSVSLAILFTLGFLLFSVFILNPLEGSYPHSLCKLVPITSEAIFYLPFPQTVWDKACGQITKISQSKSYREFEKSPLYQEIRQNLRVDQWRAYIENLQKQAGVNFFQLKYLWKFVGQEVLVTGRFNIHQQPEVILLTRVSWLIKLLDNVLPYLVPQQIRQRFQMQLDTQIRHVILPQGTGIYWMRYQDVVAIANAENFLREVTHIVTQPERSLWEVRGLVDVSNQLKERTNDILVYLDTQTLQERIGRNKADFDPLALVTKGRAVAKTVNGLLCALSLNQGIAIDWQAQVTPSLSQTSPAPDLLSQSTSTIARDLPSDTFAYCTFFLDPQQLWPGIWQRLPNSLQQDMQPYLQKLNQHYGEKDIIGKSLSQYLQDEVILTLEHIDFVQENLAPFDPYPAISLMFKSPQATELLDALENIFQQTSELVQKEMGSSNSRFTFYTKDEYGRRSFLRIKYPDTSGGAIQPALGAVGTYFVVTSHVSFLRQLIDIADKIGTPLADDSRYQPLQSFLQNQHGLTAFLHGEGVCQLAENLQKQFIQNIIAYGPRELQTNYAWQARIKQHWSTALKCMKSFRVGGGGYLQLQQGRLSGKMLFPLEIREVGADKR